MIERTQSTSQHKRQPLVLCRLKKSTARFPIDSIWNQNFVKNFHFFCICGTFSKFKSQLSLQGRSLVTCSILKWISNIEQAAKLEVVVLHRSLRVTETDEKDSDNLLWRLLI